MLIYIAHKFSGDKTNIEKAKKITYDLQSKDLANCYLCSSFIFPHLEYSDIDFDTKMELHLDILQNCEKMIIMGEIDEYVRAEIDFAKLVKMEVMRLDESGKLQPFTE